MSNKKLAVLPTFNDVTDKKLQAWNRCSVYFNVCSDLGVHYGKLYVEKFEGSCQEAMIQMFNLIKNKGYATVRREVNRGLQ